MFIVYLPASDPVRNPLASISKASLASVVAAVNSANNTYSTTGAYGPNTYRCCLSNVLLYHYIGHLQLRKPRGHEHLCAGYSRGRPH